MNNPIKKRSNPFATTKTHETVEEKVIQTVEEEKNSEIVEETTEQKEFVNENTEQIVEEVVSVKENAKSEKPQPKQDKKKKFIEVENDERIKYTSTMDKGLRRKIKIVCATQGIMFSEFIENACKEKLKREGEL